MHKHNICLAAFEGIHNRVLGSNCDQFHPISRGSFKSVRQLWPKVDLIEAAHASTANQLTFVQIFLRWRNARYRD